MIKFTEYISENVSREFNMKNIKKIAEELNILIQGDYIVLFHGTTVKNINSIRRSGKLNVNTFLTEKLEVAKKYSRQNVSREKDSIVDTFLIYMGSLNYNGYFYTTEELYYKDGKYIPGK